MNLAAYRNSESEKARTQNLLGLVPRGYKTVLDIGARDGHFSRLLTEHFEIVTAMDLEMPQFQLERVVNAKGDITAMPYPDDHFDCIFCAEVLEHVPALEKACHEIARVARHKVVIGVPYRQDTRVGRTLCASCGKINPPYGHVNTFDEKRLRGLFPTLRPLSTDLVWRSNEFTNAVSAWLMTLAGHPWGTYEQEEPCIYCGRRLTPPARRTLPQRLCSATAARLDRIQKVFARPHPYWIHMVFAKETA